MRSARWCVRVRRVARSGGPGHTARREVGVDSEGSHLHLDLLPRRGAEEPLAAEKCVSEWAAPSLGPIVFLQGRGIAAVLKEWSKTQKVLGRRVHK